METPQNWGSCTRPLTHTTHSEIALVQVSHPGHETTDMNLEERQIFKQIHSSLRNKGRYFHKKNASLSSKFEKVKFWWSQVSPWQHRIRREKKRKKKSLPLAVLFPPATWDLCLPPEAINTLNTKHLNRSCFKLVSLCVSEGGLEALWEKESYKCFNICVFFNFEDGIFIWFSLIVLENNMQ